MCDRWQRVRYIVCGLMGGGSINHGATLCELVEFPPLCVRRLTDAVAAIARKRVAIRRSVIAWLCAILLITFSDNIEHNIRYGSRLSFVGFCVVETYTHRSTDRSAIAHASGRCRCCCHLTKLVFCLYMTREMWLSSVLAFAYQLHDLDTFCYTIVGNDTM